MTDSTTTATTDTEEVPPESSEPVMGMLRATVEVRPAPDDVA